LTDDEHLVKLLQAAQKESFQKSAGLSRPNPSRTFTQFVERTQPQLAQKMLGKLSHDRHRCEDLVQETYLKVWKGLLRFDASKLGRGGVLAWLFRIARNTAISQSRRRRPFVGLEAAASSTDKEWSGFPEPVAPELSPPDKAYANEVGQQLNEAVRELRPDKRDILEMHYLDQLSHKQIALLTGLSSGQVNMKLYAARQEIRARLESVVHD
jgi:RNA polymerase sigma-70 factor (ECF subfamily)